MQPRDMKRPRVRLLNPRPCDNNERITANKKTVGRKCSHGLKVLLLTSTASGRTRTRQANAISAGTFASNSKHSIHVSHAHYLLLEYDGIILGFWELSNLTSHSSEREKQKDIGSLCCAESAEDSIRFYTRLWMTVAALKAS